MGAVNLVVGQAGCEYLAPDGKTYNLTGWTADAIAKHELYLEKRCWDALKRSSLPADERDRANERLARFIGAEMGCSYLSEAWDKSLRESTGIAHFVMTLIKPNHHEITHQMCMDWLDVDARNLMEAMYNANPRYRATAETPKAETASPQA